MGWGDADMTPAGLIGLAWVILIAAATLGPHHTAIGSAPEAHGGGGSMVTLGHLTLMTVAMMGPAALDGMRYTRRNSLRWRRTRAAWEFALAYLCVWIVFDVMAVVASSRASVDRGWLPFALALAAAALWQLTPYKRRALGACHRSVPLPPTGWPADRGALHFGFKGGVACVGSCWPMMSTMFVAPAWHLPWAVALTGIIVCERRGERPRRVTRAVATVLVACSITAVALAYHG